MKKLWFLSFLMSIFTFTAISQNIQTYDGAFTLKSLGAVGNAKYDYFENENYERIYEGRFVFNWKKDQSTIDITGKFKKNLREGNWTFKVHYGSPYNADYLVIANYIDGEPDGVWTSTFKKGDKFLTSDKRIFSKGLMIDTWNYEDFMKGNKLVMKLDTESVIIESDYIEHNNNQSIKKYRAGYCILDVTKEIQSGSSEVKKFDDTETIVNLSKIERYLKTNPDSLKDVPVTLVKKTIENMWDNFFFKPYDLTFTEDIHGWVKHENNKQFYGLYSNTLNKQKTREEIRNEEKAKKIEEEAKKIEEKRIRITQEESKRKDIKSIDAALYQDVLNEINSNSNLFLKNCIDSKYATSFSFLCSVELMWSYKELKEILKTQGKEFYLVSNANPYLYYSSVYNVDKTTIPQLFNKVFETNKLSNIEIDFEGEKIKMLAFAKYEDIKIEYITSIVNVKLNKEKEISWATEIPDNHKKLIEDKIKQLEKGKYSINYRIGFLNGVVVDALIEQVN